MKDRVLLVYPPQVCDVQGGLLGFSPPLGLMYLSSYLKEAGFEVDVLDADTRGLLLEDILGVVSDGGYSHVGISVFTRTRSVSYRLAAEIRRLDGDVYISLGGPHCCLVPEKPAFVDSVVCGEAEEIIAEVFSKRLKGVITAPPVRDLDRLLYPDRSQFDGGDYGFMMRLKLSRNVTSISTSRGCPYSCSFCTRIRTMKSYRFRSPRSVVDELKHIESSGFDGVLVIDDNFNAIPGRCLEIARLIRKEGVCLDIGFQGRAYNRRGFWEALVRSGFNHCFIGIEHIKPEIVRFFNKYERPAEWAGFVRESVGLLSDNSISVGGSVILGAPMESEDDARELIDFCFDAGVDVVNTNELEFVYGSDLWFEYAGRGVFPASRLHVRGRELYPKDYVDEMYSYAWRLSLRNIPRVVGKVLKVKRDRQTPLLSFMGWVLKDPGGFFGRAHDGYGYGKRGEVCDNLG